MTYLLIFVIVAELIIRRVRSYFSPFTPAPLSIPFAQASPIIKVRNRGKDDKGSQLDLDLGFG